MTEENKRKRIKHKSIIIRALNRFTDKLYKKSETGLFGHILGSYTRENEAFKKSFIVSLIGGSSKVGDFIRKIRFTIAEQFEESRLLNLWRRLMNFLACCHLRLYGTFMMTFGIYTGLVYFFKRFIILSDNFDASYITFAVAMTLTSIPLVLTKKTLSGALSSSRTGNFIIEGFLGIPDEKLCRVPTRHGDSYNIAIVVGIVAGTLTYLIPPLYIIAFLLFFIAFALVMTYPEIGVLASFLLLPVLSVTKTDYLKLIIITYIFSYIIKLVRGKRIISFEIIDLGILFFGILILLSGLVTAAGDKVTGDAGEMILLLLGCFVAGNLLRTKHWQKRVAFAVCISGLAVSMMLIWQRAAVAAGNFFGVSLTIYEGTAPFFDGGNLLAAYLLLTLIITLSSVYTAKSVKPKFVARISVILIIAALIMTGSVSVWFGIIPAILIYFLIISRKTIPVMIFSGLIIPTTALIAPTSWVKRAFSVFDIYSETMYPMMKTWGGTAKMLLSTLLGGVGIGGFAEAYPLYARPGFENVGDSSSLYLRIISDIGIVGLIVFILIAFMFLQNCCEYLRNPLNRESKLLIAAGFSAFAGLMFQAIFCDLFSNQYIFFVLGALLSTVCAGIRSDRREIAKNTETDTGNEYTASVDL